MRMFFFHIHREAVVVFIEKSFHIKTNDSCSFTDKKR